MVTRTKKIFVGGLSATTSLEDVKNYFEQFGSVSDESFFPEICAICNQIPKSDTNVPKMSRND